MRLKRLELYGYKSFAARSCFEFSEGITAIVGPNGSGKSNIADAIRWVLGEQSYSSLRAKTTEDMIFAGSRNRARLGMAEVLLVLDNSEGWLPLDFTEVVVGRRAFRSGENEYLLNGQRVRYRDVLDVLGSGGLMRTSYTVIGQGLVDAALSLRPEARRALFEEAAGISPHLRKRAEALRRIDETERNLQRVTDILNELRPRADSLRRQAERAEEYHLLAQDLQELQRIWYGHQWQQRQRQLGECEARVRELGERLEAQRTYARSFHDRQERLAAEQQAQQRLIERVAAEQAELRAAGEALRRELAVAEERSRLYQQQSESLAGELRGLASRREILDQEVARARTELAEQEQAERASAHELEEARARLAEIEQARHAIEEQAATEQAHLTQLVATISECRARLEQLGERRAALEAEQVECEEALEDLARRIKAGSAEAQELAEREQALVRSQSDLQRQRAVLEIEIASVRSGLSSAEEAVARIKADRLQLTQRREMLARLRQELTGYHPGVREVLSPGSELQGLLGTVASLMDVPRELEQAIESALGPRLQNVIAERWEDAEAAIAHLKRTRAGWATFLPLDTLRSRGPISLRPEQGVVGVASRLVHFDERLRPAFELLLGSIIIVRDLATARRLLERRTGASLFVTLGGETVQPSGALSGGARRQTTHLLAQEREWRSLPGLIAAMEERLAEGQSTLEAQQNHLAEVQRQVRDLERQAESLRGEIERAHAAVTAQTQELRELERDHKWRHARLIQAAQELERLVERERDAGRRLAEAEQQQLEAMSRLRDLREQLSGQSGRELRQRVAELETRAAVAQRTVRSQRTLLDSHEANAAQLAEQITEKQAQRERLIQELAALAQQAEEARARLQQHERQIAESADRAEPARRELTRIERQRRDVERQRLQSLELLNQAELAHNRAVLDRDRARGELESLARDIEEDLGPIRLPGAASQQLHLALGDEVVELPEVPSVPTGLADDIRQLKARLRRLGNVNPNAPQEYEQLLDRQTFLHGQAADLRGAIAALHEVIEELDGIIERDFSATIAVVNRAFGEYFNVLFGGGSAQLVLTDPQHLSETGVEIVAQPPGKRAQSLSLLSGGERALTAVALLFALLRANPVPFCFLDEVDAALDEANVGRFRQLLEEHAQSTQFVLITHNRRTIEAAGTIYGISMGEQGVSQAISLKLEDRNGHNLATEAATASAQ